MGRAERLAVARGSVMELRAGEPPALQFARSEAGPDIAAARRVEVAPGVADQPSARGPAAAAQDFVGAKPGLGVFLVRVGHEAGIGTEIVGAPFPDVADHLAAAEDAVA